MPERAEHLWGATSTKIIQNHGRFYEIEREASRLPQNECTEVCYLGLQLTSPFSFHGAMAIETDGLGVMKGVM